MLRLQLPHEIWLIQVKVGREGLLSGNSHGSYRQNGAHQTLTVCSKRVWPDTETIIVQPRRSCKKETGPFFCTLVSYLQRHEMWKEHIPVHPGICLLPTKQALLLLPHLFALDLLLIFDRARSFRQILPLLFGVTKLAVCLGRSLQRGVYL